MWYIKPISDEEHCDQLFETEKEAKDYGFLYWNAFETRETYELQKPVMEDHPPIAPRIMNKIIWGNEEGRMDGLTRFKNAKLNHEIIC